MRTQHCVSRGSIVGVMALVVGMALPAHANLAAVHGVVVDEDGGEAGDEAIMDT